MRTWKILEMIIVFIGIPLIYYFELITVHKIIPLMVCFIICLVYLLISRDFDRKTFGFNGFKSWKPVFFRFGIAILLMTGFILLYEPDNFLIILRKDTLLWIFILLFYPVWSVFPQEVIYRAFFFHRYKDVFNNQKVAVLINGILFSFLHIIFKNWIAIICTFFISIIWASTYLKSKSLLAVSIEHVLYGNFIYTVGMGHYFYVPVFNH